MNIPAYFTELFHMGDISDIQELREKILRILLNSASILGVIIYSLAMYTALVGMVFTAAAVYSFFYVILLGITYFPNIRYQFRVYGLLFFLFALGFHNLTHSGLNVDAGLFFLTYVIMAALLLDIRKARIALGLSLVSIAYMGFEIVQKDIDLSIGLPQNNPFLWLIGGAIYTFVGYTTTLTLSILFNGLVDNLKKTKKSSAELDRKNKEILERELRYRSLVETSPNAILGLDIKGNIEMVNIAGEKLLGAPKNEIIGKNLDIFLDIEEQNEVDHISDLVMGEGVVRDKEISIRRFDGDQTFVEFSTAQIRDANDEAIGLIGIGKDITERKKADEIAQALAEEISTSQKLLRRLTQQIISAQEDERRLISRELHDDAGHALVTLKYSIDAIIEGLGDDKDCGPIMENLLNCIDLTDQAMATLRTTSHRLRPPALDVGGLHVGLEELCNQYSSQTNIQVGYQGVEIIKLPDDLSICLYRFVQEALTNTLKHAGASEADVHLTLSDGKILLSVLDNGRGPANADMQQSGIGLLGLRERFALFSGKIEIENSPSGGYSVIAEVPWKM